MKLPHFSQFSLSEYLNYIFYSSLEHSIPATCEAFTWLMFAILIFFLIVFSFIGIIFIFIFIYLFVIFTYILCAYFTVWIYSEYAASS